jgi:hypothetical protein
VKFITRAYTATKLLAKAHGPTIMVVTGVTAMGAAAITAGKASTKLEDVLEPHVDALEKTESAGYIKKELREENKKAIAFSAGKDICKLYAVPTVLFVAGAGLVFGGHRIMVKRNAQLAIAFTTLQKAYQKYRENTVRAFGPDADRAMMGNYSNQEVVDPETGKVDTISVYEWDADMSDPYNKVFEQGESDEWINDLGTNKHFIALQQQFAQEKLNRQGILYLSDVYQALGFQETPMSRLVGWRVRKNVDGSREIPAVDFGLDKNVPDTYKFGPGESIYLDFNCQGLIIGGMVQKIMEQA